MFKVTRTLPYSDSQGTTLVLHDDADDSYKSIYMTENGDYAVNDADGYRFYIFPDSVSHSMTGNLFRTVVALVGLLDDQMTLAEQFEVLKGQIEEYGKQV